MPRRSSRASTVATTDESEVRVTRKSVRGKQPEDDVAASPAKSDSHSSSQKLSKPTESPKAKGRGRLAGDKKSPRGRGSSSSSRSRGNKSVAESNSEDEDSEEPGDDGDDDFSPKAATPKKAASRGRGQGKSRGRGSPGSARSKPRARKSKADEESEEEEEYVPEEEEEKVKVTPSPSKSTRRGRSSSKKTDVDDDDTSPRRRSGRRAAKEAEEKIREDAQEEEEKISDDAQEEEMEVGEEAEDEKATESKGQKRKREEADDKVSDKDSPLKKQKTEGNTAESDATEDTGMKLEEISGESAGEEPETMKDEASAEPEKAASSEKAASPVKQSPIKDSPKKSARSSPAKSPAKAVSKSPVKESPVKESPVKESPVKESPIKKSPVKKSPVKESPVKESPVKESPVKESPVAAAPEETPVQEKPEVSASADQSEDLKQDQASPVKEAVSAEAVGSAPDKVTSSVESMETSESDPVAIETPAAQQPNITMDTSTEAPATQPDHLNDYVVVNMEDVPPPESAEITKCIPEVRVTPPEQDKNGHGVQNSTDTPTSEPTSVVNSVPAIQNNDVKPTAEHNNTNDACHAVKPSSDLLFCRQFLPNGNLATPVPADRTFGLVSYNILADCHAQRAGYPWISSEHLSLSYRHRRIMDELKFLDADVICLQEVGPEHFHKFLLPELTQLGYKGEFVKRPNNFYDEGEATFVRSSRFSIVQAVQLDLSTIAKRDIDMAGMDPNLVEALKTSVDSPGVALLTRLQCVHSGRMVTIGNVHIMWEWFKRQDIQCVQAAVTVRELISEAGGAEQPHVVCGDFNSWPGSPVYQLTKEGYLNDTSMTTLQALQEVKLNDGTVCPMVNVWWRGFQHTSSNLKSAYDTVQGFDPRSSKFPHDGKVYAVDYIWYASGSLDVVGVLKTVSEDIFLSGIPNAVFPSDHVSTKAVLSFKA